MSNREMKLRAKQTLAGNWGLAILVMLVSMAILGAAASLRGVGSALLAGPVGVGTCGVFLRLTRGETPEFSSMFDGFRNNFVNHFVAGLLQNILVAVFCILLIVPGIIKALGYSQAYFLLHDNPDLDGWTALKTSEQMMMGHKEELFLLWVSFLPWILLCIPVPFAILYVAPYISATRAQYYENLTGGQHVIF